MSETKKNISLDKAVINAQKFIISQKIVFYNEKTNQYLLLKPSEECKYRSLEFPGGLVDKGELLEEALRREIKEEIGTIEYTLESTFYVYILERIQNLPTLFIIHLGRYIGGMIQLSEEHAEFMWMEYNSVMKSDEIPKDKKDIIKKVNSRIKKNSI